MEEFFTERGRYRLFLRQGGALLPGALPALIEAANRGGDAVYADEIFLLPDGKRVPIFKTDAAPQTLLSYPYPGAPLAVHTGLLERMGEQGGETPQALARLALRLQELGILPVHIPKCFLISPRPEAIRYEKLVEESLVRRGLPAAAAEGGFPGSCMVRFGLPSQTDLAVIVPFRGDCAALQRSLTAVERHVLGLRFCCYVPFSARLPGKVQAYFQALEETGRVRTWYLPRCRNAAACKNAAAKWVDERLLLFLDAGVEPIDGRSVSRLAEWALCPRVGPVGGLLLTTGGRIANAGFCLGEDGPEPLWNGHRPDEPGWEMDRLSRCIRNTTAVGGGALLLERERFFQGRGFDETFPETGVDAEFCVRMQRQGYQCLYHPEARFITSGLRSGKSAGDPRMLDLGFSFSGGDPLVSRNPLWEETGRNTTEQET